MLSVPLSEDARAEWLGDTLDLASVNGRNCAWFRGPTRSLPRCPRLAAAGIEAQRVAIDIAAHSRMLEPILEAFRRASAWHASEAPPQIPVISNRTGLPLTAAEATDPDYWVGHLRNTVRFADGIAHLRDGPRGLPRGRAGPDAGYARAGLRRAGEPGSVQPAPCRAEGADDVHFVGVLARLWALGVDGRLGRDLGRGPAPRVPLPTYPFQRQSYFIAPGSGGARRRCRRRRWRGPASSACGRSRGLGLAADVEAKSRQIPKRPIRIVPRPLRASDMGGLSPMKPVLRRA
jgi:acyl transferase domain-containing protein